MFCFLIYPCYKIVGMWEGLGQKNSFSKNCLCFIMCGCTLYASLTMHFFLIQSPFLCGFFSSNSYGCLLSTHEIFSSLKSGSKVKISKNLELSRLLKIKKISLSTVGIFHILSNLLLFAWKDLA